MSHFALINENGIVENITVGNNNDPGEGYQWLVDNIGGTWIKTSYNTRGGVHYNPETGQPSADQSKALRKNYASIGGTYDSVRDAFIPRKPYPSWVLDEQTCQWKSTIPYPTEDPTKTYYWNEEEQTWKEVLI
jgi:hypothetical protein